VKNNDFHTHDVKKTCEHKLDIHFRTGSEYNGWFKVHDLGIARITIPMGRKPIPRKTYQSMAKQLKLNVDQLDDLLECPIKMKEYLEILNSQNLLPKT